MNYSAYLDFYLLCFKLRDMINNKKLKTWSQLKQERFKNIDLVKIAGGAIEAAVGRNDECPPVVGEALHRAAGAVLDKGGFACAFRVPAARIVERTQRQCTAIAATPAAHCAQATSARRCAFPAGAIASATTAACCSSTCATTTASPNACSRRTRARSKPQSR